jgi:hypothetical protein
VNPKPFATERKEARKTNVNSKPIANRNEENPCLKTICNFESKQENKKRGVVEKALGHKSHIITHTRENNSITTHKRTKNSF